MVKIQHFFFILFYLFIPFIGINIKRICDTLYDVESKDLWVILKIIHLTHFHLVQPRTRVKVKVQGHVVSNVLLNEN